MSLSVNKFKVMHEEGGEEGSGNNLSYMYTMLCSDLAIATQKRDLEHYAVLVSIS